MPHAAQLTLNIKVSASIETKKVNFKRLFGEARPDARRADQINAKRGQLITLNFRT